MFAAFDAVWAAASAYARAYAVCGAACANGTAVRANLAASNVAASPLTHDVRCSCRIFLPKAFAHDSPWYHCVFAQMVFLKSGDKFNVTLNLVNIVGDQVVKVSTWMASVPNKTNPTPDDYLTSGSWGKLSQCVPARLLYHLSFFAS